MPTRRSLLLGACCALSALGTYVVGHFVTRSVFDLERRARLEYLRLMHAPEPGHCTRYPLTAIGRAGALVFSPIAVMDHACTGHVFEQDHGWADVQQGPAPDGDL